MSMISATARAWLSSMIWAILLGGTGCDLGIQQDSYDCTEGERRCREICVERRWEPCDEDRCPCQSDGGPPCQEGLQRCLDETTMTVCVDGALHVAPCLGTCRDDRCLASDAGPPCAQGEGFCHDGLYHLCREGEWVASSCSGGCIEDRCLILDAEVASPDAGVDAEPMAIEDPLPPVPASERAAERAVCGNAVTEPGEECDILAPSRALPCEAYDPDFSGGIAVCDARCRFDTSMCEGPAFTCGDGRLEDGEACDPGLEDPAGCTSDCRRVGEGGAVNRQRTRLGRASTAYEDGPCSTRVGDPAAPIRLAVQLHRVVTPDTSTAAAEAEAPLLIEGANHILRGAGIELVTAGAMRVMVDPELTAPAPGAVGRITGRHNSAIAVDVYLVESLRGHCVMADAIGGSHIGDSIVVAEACGGWAVARGIAHLLGLWPLDVPQCDLAGVCDAPAPACIPPDACECGADGACPIVCDGVVDPSDPMNLMGNLPCARTLSATLSPDQAGRMRCIAWTHYAHATRPRVLIESPLVPYQVDGQPEVYVARDGHLHHVADMQVFRALGLVTDAIRSISQATLEDRPRGMPIGTPGSFFVGANETLYRVWQTEGGASMLSTGAWTLDDLPYLLGTPNPGEVFHDPTGNLEGAWTDFISALALQQSLPCGEGRCFCNVMGHLRTGRDATLTNAFLRANVERDPEPMALCPLGLLDRSPFVEVIDGLPSQLFFDAEAQAPVELVFHSSSGRAWFVEGPILDAWRCIGRRRMGAPTGPAVDGRQMFEGGLLTERAGMITASVTFAANPAGCPEVVVEPIDAICETDWCAADVLRCADGRIERCAPDGCGWQAAPACLDDGACGLPEEVCNGRDEDCDGVVDEDIEPRPCANVCVAAAGEAEQVSACVGGRMTRCSPTPLRQEVADLVDNDCRDGPDEHFLHPIRRYQSNCAEGDYWQSAERCVPGGDDVRAGCSCPIDVPIEGAGCPEVVSCWRYVSTHYAFSGPVEGFEVQPLYHCVDQHGRQHLHVWDEAECETVDPGPGRDLPLRPGLPRILGWFARTETCVPDLPGALELAYLYQCRYQRAEGYAYLLTPRASECLSRRGGFVDPVTLEISQEEVPFALLPILGGGDEFNPAPRCAAR